MLTAVLDLALVYAALFTLVAFGLWVSVSVAGTERRR